MAGPTGPAAGPGRMRDEARAEALAAAAQNAPLPRTSAGPHEPGRKRLWRVHLGSHNLTTPSPFFVTEMPGDARGRAIEADDEAAAWAIFCRLHGILGNDTEAEITELSPEEAEAALTPPPPAAKKKGSRRRMPNVIPEGVV